MIHRERRITCFTFLENVHLPQETEHLDFHMVAAADIKTKNEKTRRERETAKTSINLQLLFQYVVYCIQIQIYDLAGGQGPMPVSEYHKIG